MAAPQPPPHGPGPAWTPTPADPPRVWVIVRALGLATFAGLIAALLATFVLVVLWGALFVGERLGWTDAATVSGILGTGRWVAAGVAVALAIWSGGYGATARGSGPRVTTAILLGVPFGLGLAALGSHAWTVGALGVGWAVAVPARSVRVAAVRAIPGAVAGLALIPFTVPGVAMELVAGLGGFVLAGMVVVVMIAFVEPALWGPEQARPPVPGEV